MGIARPVIAEHPYAWVFFVGFITLTSFAVLNLFIAVIVDSMQSKHFDSEIAREEEAHIEREALIDEVKGLRADIAALKQAISDQSPDGSASSSNRAVKDE